MKGSVQLGTNFIVILIISVILLGIGLSLIGKTMKLGDDWDAKVSHYHRQQLARAMESGDLTSVYPTSQEGQRGEIMIFSLAINNELMGVSADNAFSIFVEPSRVPGSIPSDVLYIPGPYMIPSGELEFIGIGITPQKNAEKGEHTFNVYICKESTCSVGAWGDGANPTKYGRMHKIQVNLR